MYLGGARSRRREATHWENKIKENDDDRSGLGYFLSILLFLFELNLGLSVQRLNILG